MDNVQSILSYESLVTAEHRHNFHKLFSSVELLFPLTFNSIVIQNSLTVGYKRHHSSLFFFISLLL